MTSLTMRPGEPGAALETATGYFSSILQGLIAAREKEARRRTADYLSACTDDRLHGLGLVRADIQAIRAGTFSGVRS